MATHPRFISHFGQTLIDEGRTEGKRDAVLAVLAARGLALTAEQREHVAACGDAATLDLWIARAATAADAAAVFTAA